MPLALALPYTGCKPGCKPVCKLGSVLTWIEKRIVQLSQVVAFSILAHAVILSHPTCRLFSQHRG